MKGDKKGIRDIERYNIDVILTVGYRVKSKRGIAFRRWANGVLKDYIVKGVARNDRRFAQLGQKSTAKYTFIYSDVLKYD